MIAAQEGKPEVVRALLAAGADRNLRNKKRETAADIARALGQTAVVDQLR